MMFDIVTFGETMLRLTPPNFKRIEQATSFEIEVGGSESNVAVGLARLGVRVAWLSRLTDNALGRMIERQIRMHGVDTSYVMWTNEDRIGLYFLEEGAAPRGSRVTYDRANSAMSKITPEDLPADLFQRDKAMLLHVSGITVGLSATAADTVYHVVARAREAGWMISFDLNYRATLWSMEAAMAGCDRVAQVTDVFFIAKRDAAMMLGMPMNTPPEAMLDIMGGIYPEATLVMTCGEDGSVGRTPKGKTATQAAFPAEEVGRIGGGDAFVAGFLSQYILKQQLQKALAWGNAAAAMKYSIAGDMPIFSRDEVEAVTQQKKGGLKR